MHVYTILLSTIILLNIIFAFLVIFFERKDPIATWAWLMVLTFIPILGFILYLLIGQNLRNRKMFQWDERKKLGIEQVLASQLLQISSNQLRTTNEVIRNNQDLIYMNLFNNDAVLTENNAVDIYTDGKEKFDQLLKDIMAAKKSIHLQYYIFKNDGIGSKLIAALTEKAKEGLEVRLLYDELGSRTLQKRAFKELKAAGGQVAVFFPSKFHLINLRMNYRNHRKLAIIDGHIGYIGGFNVGDEYLGLNPKFGYWRDTHLRIVGTAIYAIQTRFILDWNQAAAHHEIHYSPDYFPGKLDEIIGNIGMQIVSSGPNSEWEQIKNGYIKMITAAKDSVFIQTPYFIPDASLLDTLRIAALSGIDVKIMIPNKPDHMFVYWATYSYIGEMLKAGAKVYIYENGFIHAKTLLVDRKISSVGTANIDMRSFRLNFEVNAFIYSEEIANSLTDGFMEDMKLCTPLSLDSYSKRSLWIKFKESFSRLLSPLL
ncbi:MULTISPECIES: cardiolipin synthase [Bacillaceae]|uniref:cardiolipin synthase n=1 Tax=Bacillaceae TaxID=186817 RepID=UPI001E651812|nr:MULTISPECIES: cardiolipin synthase [Bacillaceae]MCE4051261.1 cardiolipin synthase [Bacillus sp. Au-Bac7]MCM3032166.1 cardiolipin synthase [Niallia sp. MER 6]MDL0436759.1 cardiolipin synthase [Niallia sp. SS-2023]UPO86925.1 cardiolipin synthase [Niallia sp. Man26]